MSPQVKLKIGLLLDPAYYKYDYKYKYNCISSVYLTVISESVTGVVVCGQDP